MRRLPPRTTSIALVLTCLLLAVAGCAGEPPQKEIDQAQAAVDLARTAGADRFASEEYTAATTGLQKARTAVDQRDYRQALSYAIDARQRAQNALRQAADAKGSARRATEALLSDVAARAQQLRTRLKTAETGRVPVKELRAPRATAAEAETALQEARTAIGAENYEQAGAVLTAVRKKLDAAIRDLENIPPRPARNGRAKPSASRKGLPPTP